jgi:cell division protein ZapA (FtsZ GTPase activity inhibitor)
MVEVTLGRTRVSVPVRGDEATTHAIAQRVTEALDAIEADSPRIDTQRFALLAAFEFAAELHDVTARREGETRELVEALDRLHDALTALLAEAVETPPE